MKIENRSKELVESRKELVVRSKKLKKMSF